MSFYVSPAGSDSNPGSITAPWKTINFAVTKLLPGDTLYLREGTYREKAVVSVSGTGAAPITIQAYAGEKALIDSGYPEFQKPGNNDWELVNSTLGEWRAVKTYAYGASDYINGYIDGIPGYENQRVILVPYKSAAAFRSTSETYIDGTTPFYIGPGTFWDPNDSRIHIRLSKTSDLRSAETRYGVVFSSENPDPRNYAILLSQTSSALAINGSYLVFKDIGVNPAERTITLSSDVHDVRFEGITAWVGVDSAMETVGPNVHHITLTRSKIYGDNPPWIFWSDMKNPPAPADLLRSSSIDLRSGAHDWEISYNHIRGSGQDLISTNTNEYNIAVHHNRMENGGDDALEIEGTQNVGRMWIYKNYIANCLTVIAPGQDTPAFTGPLYVYRNVFSLLRNPPINRKAGINTWNGGGRYGFEYMFKQSGTSYSTRNVHTYHNTLVMLNTAGNGLNLIPKYPDGSIVANNLAIMVNGIVNRDYRTAPGTGQVVDGNLYWKVNTVDSAPLLSSYNTVPLFSAATGLEARGIGSVSKRGTDPLFDTFLLNIVDKTATVWALAPGSDLFKPSDFFLGSGSPARNTGIALPLDPNTGAQLPNTETSQDIGAIPFGASASEYDIFPFVLTPPTAPAISVQPQNVTVTAGQTATFSVTATGTAPLAYQWQKNGVNVSGATGSSTTTPATALSDSGSTFRCVVTNSAGTATSALAFLTVNPAPADTTAPTVNITSPASGTTTTSAQTVTISASASDNVGVTKVEFYDGATLKGADTSSPYAYGWAITSSDNGTHSWTAKAFDAAGNSAVSSGVTLTVNIPVPPMDTTPPTVSITSPADGSSVPSAGRVKISVSATDNVGVSKVEIQVDGALKATLTSAPYTYTWNARKAATGSHTITATAYDAAGNNASTSIIVNK